MTGTPNYTHQSSKSLGRNFRWIWGAQAISLTGTQLSAMSIQIIAVTGLHANANQMGVLVASQTLPYLVLGMLLGVLIDQSSRRMLMIVSDVSRFLVLSVAAVLAFRGCLTLWVLCVIVLVTASFTLIFDASLGALIPEMVPRPLWLTANSRLSATVSVGEVLGPGLGGVLIQAFSAPFAIFSDAISYAISGLCVRRCGFSARERGGFEASGPATCLSSFSSGFQSLREGVRFVASDPILRLLGTWSAIWNFSWSSVLAVFVLHCARMHISSAVIGLLFATGGVGGVLGASVAGSLTKRLSRGTILAMAPVLGAVGASSMLWPFGHAKFLLAISLFVFNLGQSAFSVNMQTVRQEVTPARLMGRMDTVMRLCFTGMSSIGALVGGAIGSRYGINAALAFGLSGLLFAAAGIWLSALRALVDSLDTLVWV